MLFPAAGMTLNQWSYLRIDISIFNFSVLSVKKECFKVFSPFSHTERTQHRKNISHSRWHNVLIFSCVPSSNYGIKTTSQKSSISKRCCVWVCAKHIPFQWQSWHCQQRGGSILSLMATSTCVPKEWSSPKRLCTSALDLWKAVRIIIRQSSVNRAVALGVPEWAEAGS